MSLSANAKTQLLDDGCAVIEEMGGVGVLLDDLAEYSELLARMTKMHVSLMEQYPDRWVAMGKGGVLAVGDSMDEALDKFEGMGMDRSGAVVKFMDTDPPVLIL